MRLEREDEHFGSSNHFHCSVTTTLKYLPKTSLSIVNAIIATFGLPLTIWNSTRLRTRQQYCRRQSSHPQLTSPSTTSACLHVLFQPIRGSNRAYRVRFFPLSFASSPSPFSACFCSSASPSTNLSHDKTNILTRSRTSSIQMNSKRLFEMKEPMGKAL